MEALFQKLCQTCEFESLEPLVITKEDSMPQLSVKSDHVHGPALANLFVDQIGHLEAVIQSQLYNSPAAAAAGSSRKGKLLRCAAHSLGSTPLFLSVLDTS